MVFPVSGVEVHPAIPLITAFGISLFTSMGGVSGAFLLLPFQVSVLGFTSPSVSPTNLVYNIVAIPSGVYRYIREGRMAWPLAWIIIAGTLPGVFLGAIIRIRTLPDPARFKLFVGLVLLYIGVRLVYELTPRGGAARARTRELEARFKQRAADLRNAASNDPDAPDTAVRTVAITLTRYEYTFYGERFVFHTGGVFALAAVVGVIGGTYGIGGGAIIAPFLIAVFGLPVYTIAGAALLATFLTSIAGVVFYTLIAPGYAGTGLAVAPDWQLGGLFGLGGFLGMYAGASLQKHVPARLIKGVLGAVILYQSGRYIIGFFL